MPLANELNSEGLLLYFVGNSPQVLFVGSSDSNLVLEDISEHPISPREYRFYSGEQFKAAIYISFLHKYILLWIEAAMMYILDQ